MTAPAQPTLYNLGSGPRKLFDLLPDARAFAGWRELRVDIDPACQPDIQSSLTDLHHVIPDGAAQMIYCSHVLEHFYDHEVDAVLSQFLRILAPGGVALMRQPDLAAVMRGLDETRLEQVLYHSSAGPIAALDVIFGHRQSIAEGNHFMAHRTGFTENSLAHRLLEVGFEEVRTLAGPAIEFCAIAMRRETRFQPQIDAILGFMNP